MAKMTGDAEKQPRQACTNPFQAADSIEGSESATPGMPTAPATGVFLLGSMTSMAAVAKILGILVAAVMPGGLLVVVAYLLAKTIADHMRLQEGTTGRRLSRAWAQVRWRDVWTSAKQTL